jgi:hypothetical protein
LLRLGSLNYADLAANESISSRTNSSTTSAALSGRRIGSLASIRAINDATAGGVSGRRTVTQSGLVSRCCRMSDSASRPTNGTVPVITS